MKRKISVFIASPGDLSEARALFLTSIQQLNVGFGDGADIEFEALCWENNLASTGPRVQSVINEKIDQCDVFILAMHRRWGQEATDAEPYTSYTEEEFHRAFERWKKEEKPEIFVFFKRVDTASEADPGPQLKKVMEFRKHLEETNQVFSRDFNTDQDFMGEIDNHLRAYAKGELPKTKNKEKTLVLPMEALQEVEKAKALVKRKIKDAEDARDAEKKAFLKIEALQLQIAEDAARLSKDGKVEFARQKFAGLAVETTNINILYLAYEFYERTGDLDSAFAVLEKWLRHSGADNKSPETASAYGNLGALYYTQGDLPRAEEMHQKSLEINEALGHKAGMANAYENLGALHYTQGDFTRAEKMFQKALEINEALGRKADMAHAYGNLGALYYTQGDLPRAEEMQQKSLEINEALDHKEGMANAYGSLGNLYYTQGDLTRAEKMFQKALAIDKALGRKVGIAASYSNLGSLYYTQGDLTRAEKMHQKALAIHKALGHKVGMAACYHNLGILYRAQGDFARTEEMQKKALAINEALGRQ